MSPAEPLRFDEHGAASLDGLWEFFPGDHLPEELDGLSPETIRVPGLWEAQGWLELDGHAWYRRRFRLDDSDGFWSLRFGAVMDVCEVWLNGVLIGGHDNPFTPFLVDPTAALQTGENLVAVRVFDPNVNHPDHIRLAHGKQGWANHVFPSRPSLYMTYGGIWQSVVLWRHGPVLIQDVFVNSDPDDLTITVTLRNLSHQPAKAALAVRAVHGGGNEPVELSAGETVVRTMHLGSTPAARWSPASPALHRAIVDVTVGGAVSDHRSVRFGLRSLRIEGKRLLIDGVPYRMKSALVQGFRAEELYAEGPRSAIEEEVRAAQAMGFNTLRLHIKAFDPAYLEVCDELGMLLHCDIPVAEPIAHTELGREDESEVARRSVEAVRQQVSRDRNHPSVILWSVMNELCLDRIEARSWDNYERFARALVAAAKDVDPTRPIIENDWVEPDPDRVFAADVLTAHWYGRLHGEYLDKIERACVQWSGLDVPLYVTEFGDWGLPQMPSMPEPPFWDTRGIYALGLAETRWPGSISRFVTETQRYQGLSDRLQAEVFRRHDHIGGYCLTELTDVPHELNGLLDLHRQPKRIAAAEMARANQTLLPMLRMSSLVVITGEKISAELSIANDGPALDDVEIQVHFGDAAAPIGVGELLAIDTSELAPEPSSARFRNSAWATGLARVPGHAATSIGTVVVAAPAVPGSHDLFVRLRTENGSRVENRYTLHVVAPPAAPYTVQVLGAAPALERGLGRLGTTVGETGPTIVSEGALDEAAAPVIGARLAAGGIVVVLAQTEDAQRHYPIPVTLMAVATKWGSSVFHFTTDHGALPSLPRRNLLVAEDSTVQAQSVVTTIDGQAFPEAPVVIAYKPVPDAMTGTIVGSQAVGSGRLVFCQYRLCDRAAGGDAAALAILADLVGWAAKEQAVLEVEAAALVDGRRVARYSHCARLAQ